MTEPTPKSRSRAWRWWLAGGAAAVVLALVAGACWFWLVGRKVWTDDESILVSDSDADVRQVLWTAPAALGKQFNTPAQEYEPAMSADQTELYFVRGLPGTGADIYVSRRGAGGWGEPVPVAAVNTPDADELGPRLTPDGQFLLFYSDRAGGAGMYDLWAAERTEEGWGKPFNLGPSVNTRWNEYSPTVGMDGRLYFATNRNAAERQKDKDWRATIRQTEIGDYDLFVAAAMPVAQLAAGPNPPLPRGAISDTNPALSRGAIPSEIENRKSEIPNPKSEIAGAVTRPTTAPSASPPALAFAPAVELAGVNTPAHEGACCVSPGGDFLYFASDRPGGLGGFDLYRARLRDGRVLGIENLGPRVNSPANDTDPQLAMGGFQMLFSSDRPGSAGGYDLFTTLSREVYALRESRPPPALGWQVWALLAAVAVAIPMLLFLRAGGYRHLDLLQKCLFVSLLIHVLLIGLFNFVILSRKLVAHVAREAGLTVAVNLDVAREVEMRTQVRDQITDLPLAELKTADLERAEVFEPPRAAPPPMEVNIPKVEIAPARASVAAAMPTYVPPRPADELSLPPPPIPAEQPKIALAPPEPLKVDPVAPEPIAPQPVKTEAPKLTIEPPKPEAPPEQKLTPSVPEETLLAKAVEQAVRHAEVEAVRPAPKIVEPREVAAAGPAAQQAVAADQPKLPDASAPPAPVERAQIDSPAEARPTVADATPVRAQMRTDPLAEFAPAVPKSPAPVEAIRPRAAPPTADLEVAMAAPKAAGGSPAAELPKADATAVRTERVAPAAAADKPVVQVDAARPTRASVSAEAVSRPQATTRPAVVVAARPPMPAPPAVEELAAVSAGPVTPRSPVPAARPEDMVVPDAPARIEPVRTQSPQGRAEVAGPAIPTATPVRHAPIVAVSVTGRRPARPAPVAVDIPAAVPADELTLPVLAVAGQSAPSQPLMATGLEPLQPVERRPLSAVRPERPPEVLTRTTIQTTAPRAAPSLTHQPLAAAARPRTADLAAREAFPRVPLLAVTGSLEPGRLTGPEALAQRSVEQRQTLIAEMGGSKESEASVGKALVYLARSQQPDGRWTYHAGPTAAKAPPQETDVGLTGLSLLAYLAADHTPAKDGPYRQTVGKAADYLISQQKADGDLRGRGRMYCHAIATLALAEAALMTGDDRYRQAAVKGAEFIVKAQNPTTGGWRYAPGDPGDTSVVGWQVMALKSVENLGYKIPDKTRAGALRWLDSVATGKQGMLAGYTSKGETPAMTAEAAFSRMMLGVKLTDAQVGEITDYLLKHPPGSGANDAYCWYYCSLALMQLQGEPWQKWNDKMRDYLLKRQTTKGDAAGSWEPAQDRYGQRNSTGRVYTTAMSTLTLEVYYRYLPLYGRRAEEPPEKKP